MSAIFATKNDVTASAKVINIHVVRPSGWETLKETLSAAQQKYAAARQFTGKTGQKLRLPDDDGNTAVSYTHLTLPTILLV